jgi:hypothetical protein
MSKPVRSALVRSVSCAAVLLALGLSPRVAGAADRAPATSTPATDLPVLLDTIRANRKALIGVNLALSPEEAAKFWPVYDRYAKDIAATGDKLTAVVDEYTASFATLSNERALQLVDAYLAADAERVKIRQSYVAEFAKVLPGRTVARFYQLENKMDAVIRFDLAAAIPVIDEKAAAPAK